MYLHTPVHLTMTKDTSTEYSTEYFLPVSSLERFSRQSSFCKENLQLLMSVGGFHSDSDLLTTCMRLTHRSLSYCLVGSVSYASSAWRGRGSVVTSIFIYLLHLRSHLRRATPIFRHAYPYAFPMMYPTAPPWKCCVLCVLAVENSSCLGS